MAPDSEQCERGAARGGAGAGGRVLPGAAPAPAGAWLQPDSPPCRGPAESHRLLPAPVTSLQDGPALAEWPAPAHTEHPATAAAALLAHDLVKPKVKTKNQKRKERIIAALKPPYFILSMIIVITGVHWGGGAAAAAALEWTPPARARALWWRQPWRLLTYGCVHATDAHLALNALVALAVGWRLEREQGAWRVAALWAGGAAGGALQPRVRVVGASAAVYALLTAHLPNVAYRFGHIPLWWFRPLSVVVLAASEGCWALLRAAPAAPAHSPAAVAWSAHIFGAAVGVPIAFLVFTGENKSSRWAAAARAVSAVALVVLAALALAGAHYGGGGGGCAAGAGAGAGAGALPPAAGAVRELSPPPHHL